MGGYNAYVLFDNRRDRFLILHWIPPKIPIFWWEEAITGRLHFNQHSREQKQRQNVQNKVQQSSFQTLRINKNYESPISFKGSFFFDIQTFQTLTRGHINKQIIPCWLVLCFLLTSLWLKDWNILTFLPLQPINLIPAMSFMTWL